jgi:predicted  nucleic acid-binding Zn-ribbon protein
LDPDLVTLVALQEKDQAVAAIELELKAIEPQVAALDDELARLDAELASARKGVDDAGVRRTELEGKIEGYRLMQERRRQRLEWVRGAKEAATLMAELDLARSVLAKEEAEWIRSADRVQEAERRVAEIEKRMEDLRVAQAPRREQITAIQAECQERLTHARSEREEASRLVKRPLLSRYEKIRRGNTPLALYPLHGDACGQCYTSVPIHRRKEVQGGQGITNCEACGVLIYSSAT